MTKKKEQVSVSFHYIEKKMENDENKLSVFTNEEFIKIYNELEIIKNTDNTSEEIQNKLKFNKSIIVKKLEILDDNRTICGLFENSYSGHEYRNSEKGLISADSLNFRPFFFLLYIAESGRIYVATQYLGHYGGYTALKNTIENLIDNKKKIEFYSFSIFSSQLDKFIPQEVVFNVAQQSKSISGKNTLTQNIAITLKNKDKSIGYQDSVKENIFPFLRKPKDEIINGLKEFLKENDLISMPDINLEGCKVIGTINNKKVTIYILDGNNYATKFPLDIECLSDGHPDYEVVKTDTLIILKDKIIARQEDV